MLKGQQSEDVRCLIVTMGMTVHVCESVYSQECIYIKSGGQAIAIGQEIHLGE